MAIPESQLDVWAKQGSVTQSQATYQTMRTALISADAPYSSRSYNVFLQGSYGNETNIYSDSDVDVIIVTDSIYYFELDELSEDDKAKFHSGTSSGSYSYNEFKGEVQTQLTRNFGSSVKPGKKAIFVEGNGSRRDADVLAAAEHRRYHRFRSYADQSYSDGITFWTAEGTKIVNYPKQHSANCTAKHQRTSSRFKPSVRVLKNMRNAMVAKGYLKEGIAPSYFLEGMLYNVPDGLFSYYYEQTIPDALNWVIKSDRDKLVCANEMYYLINPSSPVTWRAEGLQAFLDAAVRFWNDW